MKSKVEITIFSIKLVKSFLDNLYNGDYYDFDACFDEMIKKIQITGNNSVEMSYQGRSKDFICEIEEVEVDEDELDGFNTIKIVD